MKAKIIAAIIAAMVSSLSINAQKVEVREIDGVNYAVIVASDGAAKGTETRQDADLYYNAPLYTFDGTSNPSPTNTSVKKIVRHYQTGDSYYSNGGSWVSKTYNPNQKVSATFAVSPTNVWSDGGTKQNAHPAGDPLRNTQAMTWSMAAGWLGGVNALPITEESYAQTTGCYMYKGENGTDELGTWRLPTQRELMLIWILKEPLLNTASKTSFDPFLTANFWTATEVNNDLINATHGWYLTMSTGNTFQITKSTPCRVRCIRDL